MFCEKCGAKLPDDAKFCESCGISTEPKAPSAPSPFLTALKKFFSKKRNVIISAVTLFLLIAIIVTVAIIASQPKKIYVDDYFHVVFKGVDESGRAYIEISEAEQEKLVSLNKKLFGEQADEESIFKYIEASLDIPSNKISTLKNGDTVKLKLNIDKSINEKTGGKYKFILRNQTVTVKGLYKKTTLNLLDYIQPSFKGYNGFGRVHSDEPTVYKLINGVEARVSANQSELRIELYDSSESLYITTVYAQLDRYSVLFNGDKINATVNAEKVITNELYSSFAIILSSQTKEYTVEGLSEPLQSNLTNLVNFNIKGKSSVAVLELETPPHMIDVGDYKLGFSKSYASYYREFTVTLYDKTGNSLESISYRTDYYQYIKNGDKIVFTTYSSIEDIVNRHGVYFPSSIEISVTDLDEPFNADPISRGSFIFTGCNGYGGFRFELPEDKSIYVTDDGKYTVKLSLNETSYEYIVTVVIADENGRNFATFNYECYKSTNLKNGDKIYFICSEGRLELCTYVEEYEIYFPYEVIVTADGLPEPITVNPLDNVTFAYAKDGEYVKMTLGLKEKVITVGENTIELSLENTTSWGNEYTKVKATVKDKDGKAVGACTYQFRVNNHTDGSSVFPSCDLSQKESIAAATGIVLEANDFFVIASSK